MLKSILILCLAIAENLGKKLANEDFTREPNCFEKIVKTKTFVDKTLFIKQFLSLKQPTYFSAPRNFGKRTNMNMLRSFLNLPVDKDGGLIDIRSTDFHKLFSKNKLNIYKDKKFFYDHFGRYPVLYFDFSNITFHHFNSFVDAYREIVSGVFSEHKYLLKSSKLNDTEKEMIEGQLSNLSHQTLDLSYFLHKHFGVKCIVLVDGFDAPLIEVLQSKTIEDEDVEALIRMMVHFYWALLNNNTHVSHALLHATTRQGVIFTTEVQNITLRHYSDRLQPFLTSYGLVEVEVTELARKFNKLTKLDDIRHWYGGYNVMDSNIMLHSTASVVEYFKTGEFKNYWADSSSVLELKILFMYSHLKGRLETILKENRTIVALEASTYNTMKMKRHLQGITDSYNAEPIPTVDYVLGILTDIGYFNDYKSLECNRMEVNIPNREMREGLMAGAGSEIDTKRIIT